MRSKLLFSIHSLFFVLFASVLVAAQDQGRAGAFALRDGDRVLFYGDSITAQRFYTRDVEEFLLTRYPTLNVEFFCAGVSGDTVYGGYAGDTTERLARDVIPLKPTVVTVMLGMNDPGYVPFDQHIFDVFRSGYESLIGKLTSALPQARLTLIASSPYDELTHGTDFPGLSGTVQKYGMFVKQKLSGLRPRQARRDCGGRSLQTLPFILNSLRKRTPGSVRRTLHRCDIVARSSAGVLCRRGRSDQPEVNVNVEGELGVRVAAVCLA